MGRDRATGCGLFWEGGTCRGLLLLLAGCPELGKRRNIKLIRMVHSVLGVNHNRTT